MSVGMVSPHMRSAIINTMDIKVVKKDEVKDRTEVDIINITESKNRTTPERLKMKRDYLIKNIEKWQADLAETDRLIAEVYKKIDEEN